METVLDVFQDNNCQDDRVTGAVGGGGGGGVEAASF